MASRIATTIPAVISSASITTKTVATESSQTNSSTVADTNNSSRVHTQSATAGPNDASLEQRDDAKKNMLKAMRPLPFQHYWIVYFQGQRIEPSSQQLSSNAAYTPGLQQIGSHIGTVQDFWRYSNNLPIEIIKMRESLYLFKQGFLPVWEDRRNIHGGSWTFRVPKVNGSEFWTRILVMAVGEKLQGCLDLGDQLCGVGVSVRFNSHLISIWHRDATKQKSIDAILKFVLEELPSNLCPKNDSYFYKKHSDHAGFKAVMPSKSIISVPEISAQVCG